MAYMKHDLNHDFCCDPRVMYYILNITSYCACIFSIRYVLPNHMLLQIAESLPREMQGILACCNPIPPLVRQNLLALHRIILEARDQPLVKVNILLLLIFFVSLDHFICDRLTRQCALVQIMQFTMKKMGFNEHTKFILIAFCLFIIP